MMLLWFSVQVLQIERVRHHQSEIASLKLQLLTEDKEFQSVVAKAEKDFDRAKVMGELLVTAALCACL